MIPARSFAVERARLSVAVRYALDPGQDAEESPARLAGMLSCSASWLAATSCAADHCPNPGRARHAGDDPDPVMVLNVFGILRTSPQVLLERARLRRVFFPALGHDDH
jgi:hypothetical protein